MIGTILDVFLGIILLGIGCVAMVGPFMYWIEEELHPVWGISLVLLGFFVIACIVVFANYHYFSDSGAEHCVGTTYVPAQGDYDWYCK